jgi:SulP family sulfate permease
VGRVGDSEHFRNVERHDVRTDPAVLAIRIDENLYFGNVRYLEQRVHELVAENPALRHVLLIASGINFVDATGLECLEHCAETLESAGLSLNLAEVKGPVMDRLKRTDLLEKLAPGRVFLSTHEAMLALGEREAPRGAIAPAA